MFNVTPTQTPIILGKFLGFDYITGFTSTLKYIDDTDDRKLSLGRLINTSYCFNHFVLLID